MTVERFIIMDPSDHKMRQTDFYETREEAKEVLEFYKKDLPKMDLSGLVVATVSWEE